MEFLCSFRFIESECFRWIGTAYFALNTNNTSNLIYNINACLPILMLKCIYIIYTFIGTYEIPQSIKFFLKIAYNFFLNKASYKSTA